MNTKPIIIVTGEPNSVFIEIFFKALKYKKYKKPIILIGSMNILKLQMKKLRIKKKINSLELSKLKDYNLDNKSINLINVNNHLLFKSYWTILTFLNLCCKMKLLLTFLNICIKFRRKTLFC